MTESRAIELLEYIRETGNGEAPYVGCAQNIALNMAIQALEEVQQYRAIGTVEEFKALKENQRKCEDCAGCTVWKCDCANEREHAIDEFANFMHEKAKENNGLRLSSETKSWTHASIFDYVKEFKDKETNSI